MVGDRVSPSRRTRHRLRLRASRALAADAVFARRVAIVAGFAVLAYSVWLISYVVLLAFLALLLAVIIRAAVDLVRAVTGLPENASFGLGLFILITGAIGFLVFFAGTIYGQLADVLSRLPMAIETLGGALGIDDPVGLIEEQLAEAGGTTLLGRAAGLGFSALGGVVDAFIAIMAAIYLAYDPGLYRRGLVRLFPAPRQAPVEDALVTTGRALRLWFIGQLVSMLFVGVAGALAFWWIGLPAPAALGLIAGLTNFVPFIGPVLGSIPALVFAFNVSLEALLWTLGFIVVVQQVEGNVIVPLVQRRAVMLPPALGLFAIVAFGLLYGFIGVFLAVPIAVTLMVLVKMLWMRGALGEETQVPGEQDGEKRKREAGDTPAP